MIPTIKQLYRALACIDGAEMSEMSRMLCCQRNHRSVYEPNRS